MKYNYGIIFKTEKYIFLLKSVCMCNLRERTVFDRFFCDIEIFQYFYNRRLVLLFLSYLFYVIGGSDQ